MKYLHTMVRVSNLNESLSFYSDALGLNVLTRKDFPEGRFTLIYLAAPDDSNAQLELTYNWDEESYTTGRNFGHIAYEVDDIYTCCKNLQQKGIVINRPPRDGRMAFIRSPDGVSIELLQKGNPLDICEPWKSMPNVGIW